MSLPLQIEGGMKEGVAYLKDQLICQHIESDTHFATVVAGWESCVESKGAIAKYLVGLIACAIDAALNIRANLANTPGDRLEILQAVARKVGTQTNPLTIDQKQDERNPWIAEGLWHLCFVLSQERRDFLNPVRTVIALKSPHVDAKDHGPDGFAIHCDEDFMGLLLVETKAYKNNPNKAINDAVHFFKSVDNGQYDSKIRQLVEGMRPYLSNDNQLKISPSFWKSRRTYIPNPHYQAPETSWGNTRPSFRTLFVGKENIIVMPHIVRDFDEFFDDIGNKMYEYAASLPPCTTSTQNI